MKLAHGAAHSGPVGRRSRRHRTRRREGETVTFALDGSTYEIDLSRKNADALRGVIYDYMAHARKVGGVRRTAKKAPVGSGPSAAEVRAWAKENGHEVPDRGRVPQDVRDAYEAAH